MAKDQNGNEIYPGHRRMSVRPPEPEYKPDDKKPVPDKKKKKALEVIIFVSILIGSIIIFAMCSRDDSQSNPTEANRTSDKHENRIVQLKKRGYVVDDRGIMQKGQISDVDVESQVRQWRIVADKSIMVIFSRGRTIIKKDTLKSGEIKDYGIVEYNNEYLLNIRFIGLYDNTRVAYLVRRY